jgi:hypothetical protein
VDPQHLSLEFCRRLGHVAARKPATLADLFRAFRKYVQTIDATVLQIPSTSFWIPSSLNIKLFKVNTVLRQLKRP